MPIMVKTIHGFKLGIDPMKDQGVEREIFYSGTYESGVLSILEHLLKKGDVFVDVGANIGLMSIFAAQEVGPSGKVIAIEANPNTAEILSRNLSINNLSSVQVMQCAIGNSLDSIKIYDNFDVNRGASSVIPPEKLTDSYQVSQTTLDKALFGRLMPSIVKIDVEGAELDVLLGSRELLSSLNPPIVVMECSADYNIERPTELFNFFESLDNYKICKSLTGKAKVGKLKLIEKTKDMPKHDNIYCFPKARLNDLITTEKSLFVDNF